MKTAHIHSLRTKILIIVLVFITSMGASFFIYSMSTTVNYRRLRLDGIESTVESETGKINKIIAELERGAIDLAIDGLLFYLSQSYRLGETSVLEYLRSYAIPAGGGFWFEPYAYNPEILRACVYAYYDKEDQKVKLDEFNVSRYNYHDLYWYREITDKVTYPYQVVWTKPYVDDTTYSLMTTAGAGIFDTEGRLIGISIIDWDIENVVKKLLSINLTKNSFVLLCMPVKDYVISGANNEIRTGYSLNDIPWDLGADSFIYEGKSWLRFGRYMDNGWLLSVQIPEDEIFAEIETQNNRFSVIIALSSVLMLVLAYLLISKLINTPIKRLTSDVSQIALGNLDKRIRITSRDELGLLAEAFNKVTADLKDSIEEQTREHAEKEKINTELGIAKSIQTSMIPCIFPPFPDRNEFELYAMMLPAKEVGGDFYDFYFIDRDNLAVVIADVSGKSIPAALFMVIAKLLIKNNIYHRSPKAIFELVNNKLCEGNEACMFVTAFIGIFNIPSGKFVYVNAGHNPPLLKKHDREYEFIKSEPCIVLGFMKDMIYREEELILESGDTLFLYTDGVTEAMNPGMELLGDERLLSVMNRSCGEPPKELLDVVKAEVDIFTDGAEQADDITMLALRVNDPTVKPVKHLTVEAKAENLSEALDFLSAELQTRGLHSVLQNEICIAAEEVFMNIVSYAYGQESGCVTIFVSANEKTVIRFEDSGRPFNPLDQTAPDFEKPLAERDIGGLGIYLLKEIMDNVEYFRLDNKNVLIISKATPTNKTLL